MRFRAKLAMEHVQLLHSLIHHISRLKVQAVVHLNEQHVRLSTRDAEGISCFAELTSQSGIFLDHRIESMAPDNAIAFEIDLIQWKTALQSVLSGGGGGGGNHNDGDHNDSRPRHGRSSNKIGGNLSGSSSQIVGPLEPTTTTMKLAKRNGGIPCLCLDSPCGGDSVVDLHHAIPVRVMRVEDVQYHLPPAVNRPDVQLALPLDGLLRTVVERMKAMSPQVYVEGSMKGEMTLRIDSDGASIRTFFNQLIPRFEDCNAQEDASCTIKVDTKKLATCLQWQATMMRTVSSAMLCMVENEMLAVHVILNPASVGFFTYYVPVHFLSRNNSELD